MKALLLPLRSRRALQSGPASWKPRGGECGGCGECVGGRKMQHEGYEGKYPWLGSRPPPTPSLPSPPFHSPLLTPPSRSFPPPPHSRKWAKFARKDLIRLSLSGLLFISLSDPLVISRGLSVPQGRARLEEHSAPQYKNAEIRMCKNAKISYPNPCYSCKARASVNKNTRFKDLHKNLGITSSKHSSCSRQ